MNSSNNTIYPWQESQWQQLGKRRKNNSLPHALLFSGLAGVGKLDFAQQLSAALLCEQQADYACGKCHSCSLLKAGNHPDFLLVEPEESHKAIKVDAIRQLVTYFNQTAQYAQGKVVVLNPADHLNIAASNALLKTLEEPAENHRLILLSERSAALSATVRSRCQLLNFPLPNNELAMQWLSDQKIDQPDELLRLADGSPLRARSLSEGDFLKEREALFLDWRAFLSNKTSLVALSAQWSKLDIQHVVHQLLSWTTDLLRLKQLNEPALQNQDHQAVLIKLAGFCLSEDLYHYYDSLLQAKRILLKNIALNKQLLIEKHLIFWKEQINAAKKVA